MGFESRFGGFAGWKSVPAAMGRLRSILHRAEIGRSGWIADIHQSRGKLLVRTNQMVPIFSLSSPPRKQGPRAASTEQTALDARFHRQDGKKMSVLNVEFIP